MCGCHGQAGSRMQYWPSITLCIRVRITHPRGNGIKDAANRKCFDVFKLTRRPHNNQETQECFIETVEDQIGKTWTDCNSGEEMWTDIRNAFTEAGKAVLGTCKKQSPDWFRESEDTIIPALVRETNNTTSGSPIESKQTWKKFREARTRDRKVIREAKNVWFEAKAEKAQGSRFGRKIVWKWPSGIYNKLEEGLATN